MLKKREILYKENTCLKRAVFINAFSKYVTIFINIGFSAVLSRILTPEDYGMSAVVTVFTGFFSLLADMGLGAAIIQNKELVEEDNDNIYSFSVFLGIVLCMIFIAFSYPMALFYGNMEFFKMGMILSVSLLLNAANMVPNALLMKNKLFVMAGARTVTVCAVYGMSSVILALLGFRYYSIVFSSVIQSVLIFFWNRSTVRLHFKIRYDFRSIRKVAVFSIYQFAFNVVNYFSKNIDNLLTGKYMGNAMLGYYDKAYKLMQYPASAVSGVITPALHPILSDFQDSVSYIYKQYIKISRFLMLIGVFVSVYCFAAAYEIINILYGSRWDLAVPCLKWFSIGMWVQVVNGCTGSFFQSMNKTNYLFMAGAVNSLLNTAAVVLGIMSDDIEALSMYIGIFSYISFVLPFYLLSKKVFSATVSGAMKCFWKELLIAAGLVISCVVYPFPDMEQVLCSFVIKTGYYCIVYLFLLLCTGDFKFLLSFVRKERM